MPWIRVDAAIHRNGKVASLPNDSARWAYVVALAEAKHVGGQWANGAHWRACMGPLARWLRALVSVGLIDEHDDGALIIHDWEVYQRPSDPNAAERARRWRERANERTANGERTHGERTANGERTEPSRAQVSRALDRDIDIDRDSPVGESPQGLERPGRALTTRAPARGLGAASAPVLTNGEEREARIARARAKLADPAASPEVRGAAIAQLNGLGASLEPDEPLDFGADA